MWHSSSAIWTWGSVLLSSSINHRMSFGISDDPRISSALSLKCQLICPGGGSSNFLLLVHIHGLPMSLYFCIPTPYLGKTSALTFHHKTLSSTISSFHKKSSASFNALEKGWACNTPTIYYMFFLADYEYFSAHKKTPKPQIEPLLHLCVTK